MEWIETNLPDFGKLELTRGERINLYRGMLDSDGLNHIINGGIAKKTLKTRLLGRKAAKKLSKLDIEVFEKSLTEKEKIIANRMQNIYNPLGVLANGVLERTEGRSLELKPFYDPQHTIRDVSKTKAHRQTTNAKDWLSESNFTKARTKRAAPVYIEDAFAKLHSHIQATAKFVGYVEPLRDMKLLLSRSNYKQKVVDTWGTEMLQEIEHYVSDMEVINREKSSVSNAIDFLKNRIATSYLISPTVALKQILSRILATTEMPMEWYKLGVKKFKPNSVEVVEYWSEMSPQIRERLSSGFDREVSEANSDLAVARDLFGVESLPVKGMKIIKWGDSRAVFPVLTGYKEAYDKGLTSFKSEQEMIKAAERTIHRSQPAYAQKDLPRSLRDPNPVLRMFTMFTTFQNKVYHIENRLVDRFKAGKFKGKKKELGRQISIVLWSAVIGAAVLDSLGSFVKNIGNKDYNPISLAKRIVVNFAKYPVVTRQLGFAIGPIVDKLAGNWWAEEGVETPVDDILALIQETTVDWIETATDGDIDKLFDAIDGTLETVVTYEGLPYRQMKGYGGAVLRVLAKIAEVGIDAAVGQEAPVSSLIQPKEETDVKRYPSMFK